MVARPCFSAGDIAGAFGFERLRAADLSRRRDAVRFDVRLCLVEAENFGSSASSSSEAVLDACSSLVHIVSKGWFDLLSSGTDDEMVFDLLSCVHRRLIGRPGVEGLLDVYADSLSVSSDGMESLDRERSGGKEPNTVSSSPKSKPSSSLMSSGGLNKSRQECGLDNDDAVPLSSLSDASPNSSSMNLARSVPNPSTGIRLRLEGVLMARKAATEGGRALGS